MKENIMMSDEEKKAVEVLRYVKNKTPFIFWYEDKPYNRKETIDTILNLIEKQSKEIEELKMITKEYDSFLGNEKIIIADKSYFDDGYFKEKFISKDKIKAKIEEFKIIRDTIIKNEKDFNRPMMTYDYCEKMLQSLLEKEY